MIDQIDHKLISLLQENGRLTNAELAEATGISVSSCHRRVKQLEDAGVITGYAAVVDRAKLGLQILAYVFVKLEGHSDELLEEFIARVKRIDEVVSCHAISGGGDYILKIVAADMDAYANVALKEIALLPGIKDSESNFVLATLKASPGWPPMA